MNPNDASSAWAAIATTAAVGRFVPVIGFDVAASTNYSDARAMTPGAPPQAPSVQKRERKLVERRLAALREHLQRMGDERAAQFIAGVQRSIAADGEAEEITPNDALFEFELAVARLTAALTFEWAGDLSRNPAPLKDGHTMSIVEASEEDSFGRVRAALDAALRLRQHEDLPGTFRSVDAYWVYVKLLIFVAETVGSSAAFWQGSEDPSFVTRHKAAINDDVTLCGNSCGWNASGAGVPELAPLPGSRRSTGVEFSHLVWLEELLWFALLSQTRAYRTRAQVAFALSLDDEGAGIPRLPADPFEMGLLYSRLDVREIDDLASIMKHCSTDEDGLPRPPGAFHLALAKMFQRHAVNTSLKPAIIFALGMDLDMERALATWFGSYRVLIPVYLPLKELNAGAAEERGKSLDHTKKAWLLLTVTKRGPEEDAEWDLAGEGIDLQQGGPVVIKLYGSPAHDLPLLTECRNQELVRNTYDPSRPPMHRLVLDELELMSAVSGQPSEAEMPGFVTRFKESMFFLFGDDALSWGDRAPYLIPDSMRGTGANAVTGEVPQVSNWNQEAAIMSLGDDVAGQGEAAAPPDSRAPLTMAAAHRGDQFVQGMWRQLNVAPVGDGVGVQSITSRIVTEVSKW